MNTFDVVAAGWRALVHVSEWSGLSIGALAGLGALFYFVPLARKLAIAGAVVVVVAWACLVHGHSVGVADEDAKLQTISDQGDTRAAAAASDDEKARESAIEAKAKEQHEKDVAEIARLSAAPGCGFDPGVDDGSLRSQAGNVPAGAVNGNAQSAGGSKAPDKSAGGAAPGHGLQLPLVWRRWMPGQGHVSNAAPDG